MGWIQAAGLGVIQGVTEFLPISSSGHLVLAQSLLDFDKPLLLFDILLHVGTLAAVLAYFGRDAWRILCAWLTSLAGKNTDPASARTAWLIILGSVPAAVVGILFDDFIEGLFGSPRLTSLGLIATGAFLFFTKTHSSGGRIEAAMTWRDALIIGLCQAISIIPGISRSGATITSALFLGIEREHAARFSFLLSIPVIGGAFLLKAKHLADISAPDLLPFLIGTIAAAGAGLLALGWLLRLVRKGNLRGFAYYCWAVGAAGVLYF